MGQNHKYRGGCGTSVTLPQYPLHNLLQLKHFLWHPLLPIFSSMNYLQIYLLTCKSGAKFDNDSTFLHKQIDQSYGRSGMKTEKRNPS